MYQNVVVQHLHITQRGLGGHEAQLCQFSGGIVNEHQKRAALAASLKPIMGAAIYLDQLAKPGATLTYWMGTHDATTLGFPVTGGDHELPGTFNGQMHAVQLDQLLASQRRAEVAVMCANQLDDRGTESFIKPVIRSAAAFLADQPGQTFPLITLGQPSRLTCTDVYLLCCLLLADFALFQSIQYL